MNNQDAVRFATIALRAWGIEGAPQLIKNRENAVFAVDLPDGQKAALRLHRPGYQSDNAIRSELWWAEALVAGGMAVPLPYRTLEGDVLAQVQIAGRVASLLSWSQGVPLGDADEPLPWDAAEQPVLYHALGAELAQLHMLSDAAWFPQEFTRSTWDIEALVGDDPAWGRFWENPSLNDQEVGILQSARVQLRDVLTECGTEDFGLIHADALRENVIVDQGRVKLIDFDDGIYSYRMYELGVAMSQNWDLPNRAALCDALLEGYATVRMLPSNAHTLLEPFVVLRGLASCGWVIGRYADDHPAVREYAERALNMARGWIK